MKEEIEYMQSKLLALAFQRKYFGNGERHPFFRCAEIELFYLLNEVSNLKGNRIGQRVARNFRKYMEDEPEEKREHRTYVLPLSSNQAYRIAEEIIKHEIPVLASYEIEKIPDQLHGNSC
jgi:hypothetical protein